MDIKSQLAKVDYVVTVCSIAPFQLREKKPGLYPGEFTIPACKDMFNDVEVLTIEECRFYVYLDLERGSFPVRASAEQVAVSIINDYINAQIAVDDGCYPGLFLVPGRASKRDVLGGDLIEIARDVQLRWYEALVKLADDDWSRYHQHRVITDIERHAAKAMNLEREWLISAPDIQRTADQVICLVCRSKLEPETILCPQCNFIINPDAFEKIKDRFMGKPGVGVAVQQVNTKDPKVILEESLKKK